jgi:Fe-S cluster assembly protein SufD
VSALTDVSQDQITDTVVEPAPNGIAPHSHVGGRTVNDRPAGSHMVRTTSLDVADHPVPTSKFEAWRFTPLARLRGLHQDAPFTGRVGTDLEVQIDAPDEVAVVHVGGADADELRGSSGLHPTHRPVARAWHATDQVLLVDIPADAHVVEPVKITVDGRTADRAAAGHIVVRAGTNSRATVLVRYTGSATFVENVEVVAADGANLTFVATHEWAPDTVHLAHHRIRVGRDATVKHGLLTFGGDLVRIYATAQYDGPGGSVELLGLYFADAGQHLEHRLVIDHTVPQCTSRVLYKGALQGRGAHTVWVGDVMIQATALGTDTYEMNRNLLLTDGARADSIPNLEIETGEIVGAGHASSTGRFDDEQLFYLQSRGIPEDVARRLVVRGFFTEVLAKIGIPEVTEHTAGIVEQELAITGI